MTFALSPEIDAVDLRDGNRADGSRVAPGPATPPPKDGWPAHEPKRLPTTRSRGAIFMKAALEALDAAGGAMRCRDMVAVVAARVQLTASECEISRETGKVRWRTTMHLNSIYFAKAGFIRKQGGRWELTPLGRAELTLPAHELFAKAERGYNEWKAAQAAAVSSEAIGDTASAVEIAGADLACAVPAGAVSADASAASAVPVTAPPAATDLPGATSGGAATRSLLETAKGHARTEIQNFMSAMTPYDFQDLIAALLRAMGCTISFVSSRGADGGTDILAYPDPLGAQTPHIRVQVKHRVDKATREEVAALRGIIRPGREIGLFVSSGGFTSEAVREARHGAVHIELMDWDGVLDNWLAHYKRLGKKDRRRLRLRPVYFLATE